MLLELRVQLVGGGLRYSGGVAGGACWTSAHEQVPAGPKLSPLRAADPLDLPADGDPVPRTQLLPH
eukprot:1265573-Pyramimonas_sp.AAC.1